MKRIMAFMVLGTLGLGWAAGLPAAEIHQAAQAGDLAKVRALVFVIWGKWTERSNGNGLPRPARAEDRQRRCRPDPTGSGALREGPGGFGDLVEGILLGRGHPDQDRVMPAYRKDRKTRRTLT